jgi:hypothetical protein
VLLPEPLRPMIPNVVADGTSNETPFNASKT